MEVSQAEKNVFGEGAKYHPVTGMIIETGRGALPERQQTAIHCQMIEAAGDKERADEMRRKIGLPVAADVAAAQQKAEADRLAREQAIAALVPAVEKLQETVADLVARFDKLEGAK